MEETRSSGRPFDCVVDASVGIKLFLIEPLSERADALFDHLTDTPPARFYVPDLFFIECTNIFWKYVRRFGYPADALALAVEHGATAYDSAYVALARPLSLPLVTADEGLAGRFAEGDADVRFLGDWREGAAARS